MISSNKPSVDALSDDTLIDRIDPESAKTNITIAVLVMSAFVMFLNETLLSVALNTLGAEFKATTATIQWVTSGFLLTMAIVIPMTGYLLEKYSLRQIYLASSVSFLAGTLVSAMSPNIAFLLAGRVLQACGTALIMPLLMTTIMRMVPASRLGKTMGAITVVVALAPALGPTIGGIIIDAFGWRLLFWLVLPLTLASLLTGLAHLEAKSPARDAHLDALSVLAAAIGFGGIVFGLSSIGEGTERVSLSVPLISLASGAVALCVFVRRQRFLQRDNRAFMDLRPFGEPRFTNALWVMGLLCGCMVAVTAVLLPLYLQVILHISPFASGLLMLPGGVALGIAGPLVGHLHDRHGARAVSICGSFMTAVSIFLLAFPGGESPIYAVVGAHVLMMTGLGFAMSPLTSEALGSLPNQLHSHGSAILATLQQVAGALAIALFVTLATLSSNTAGGAADEQGIHQAFLYMTALGLAGFLASLKIRGRPEAQSVECSERR